MDLTVVMNYIKPEFVILAVALWCLGIFLKKIPAFKAEWMIPLILLGVAVVMATIFEVFVLKCGFNPASIMTGVIQGILIAAVSVYGNELIKQISNKRYDDQRENIRAMKPDKKA